MTKELLEIKFNQIYNKHRFDLESYIRRRLRNKSFIPDILQSIFLGIYKSIEKIYEYSEESINHYVFAIAHRKLIDHFKINDRYEKKFIQIEEKDEVAPNGLQLTVEEQISHINFIDPKEVEIKNEKKENLCKSINSMKKCYKEMLTDYYINDIPMKDIAIKRNVSIGTVTSNLSRGTRMLTNLYKKEK